MMVKYVPLNKRSKKAQREYHSGRRQTWGTTDPVTKSVPSKKTYNRKKEKRKIGREFGNGFDAGFLMQRCRLQSIIDVIVCGLPIKEQEECSRYRQGVYNERDR